MSLIEIMFMLMVVKSDEDVDGYGEDDGEEDAEDDAEDNSKPPFYLVNFTIFHFLFFSLILTLSVSYLLFLQILLIILL